MKKKLFILLIPILFLSGCTQTDEYSKAELFQKKQECAKHIDNILLREEMNSTFITTDYESKKIEGPFFSKTLNTCFYGIIYQKLNLDYKDHYIVDALTNEILYDGWISDGGLEYEKLINERKTD